MEKYKTHQGKHSDSPLRHDSQDADRKEETLEHREKRDRRKERGMHRK